MNEARGVTLPELELTIEDAEVSRKRGYLGPETMVYTMLAARERQLTASLEREADLMAEVERLRGKPFSDRMYAALESRLQIAEAQLAAAQNAAMVRENEQSAMDAAAVAERFELRERLAEVQRRLRITEESYRLFRIRDLMPSQCDEIAVKTIDAATRAELAKEKANG
jgi:hypothetical protein